MIIDIIVLIILCYAAYKGFKNGVIVELCGFLALILGGYAAYHYCDDLALKFGMANQIGAVLAFIVILIGFTLVVGLLARLISKLLSFTALGFVDNVLGAIMSVIKNGAIIAILISSFLVLNNNTKWISNKEIVQSKSCFYSHKVVDTLFPYISFFEECYQSIKDSLPKI